MKNNTLHSAVNLLESVVIAVVLVLITAIATAKAQNDSPQIPDSSPALNGIFSPTAADRFFDAGREDFAREIDFLSNSDKYLNGDLLQFDEEIIKQMQETKPLSDYEVDDAQISESVFTGY